MGLLSKKELESVEMLTGGPPSPTATDHCEVALVKSRIPPWIWVLVAFAFLLFLGGLICFIVALTARHTCIKSPAAESVCSFSDEANRVRLPDFLKKVQSEHYVMNANNVPWKPIADDKEAMEHTKTRYFPYNADPMYLKKKTDRAKKLLAEINSIEIDQNKMKPRELKALAQVKHFLQHTFGAPYAENYYAGDWMLGPDLFCWQSICYVSYDVAAYGNQVKPKTYDDVQLVVDALKSHKSAIDRYRKNLELGVEAGMIRTVIDCQAGVDALKESYRKLSLANSSDGVLDEWFAKYYLTYHYLAGLENGVDDKWTASHGQNVNASIREALKEGLGEPLLELINYLEFDHKRHCLPNDLASGLASLPVDYVYNDGIPDKTHPTVKKLPTGEPLNGSESYKLILSYFTTTDISPEKIFQEGKKQLKFFYNQVIEIAKKYTGKANETEAMEAFRNILNSSSMWHNNGSFPRNESDENAHKLCVSPETAAKFCPVRWKAVNRWARYCRQVMGMLYPKITKLFYFTGSKITAPNCPIEMLPHYNPSNGAQFFKSSDAQCSRPTYFGLPFFLKDFGPVFQEWSVTGHESRPGHHTEVQGHIEHFSDKCGGVPGWLDSITFYTASREGWGLYSENPLLSDDTDTYNNSLLQRYGMVKWQTWRAVRLIVDTGLHYRGLTRTEALKMFEKYAWDTSDFAVKEVTRYQSDPGQATAYMIGRLALIELRNKTEVALGKKFSLKDFHYQVISQGAAPLSFLQGHIDRYIKCVQGKLEDKECSYVLKPINVDKTANGHKSGRKLPLKPERRHYV